MDSVPVDGYCPSGQCWKWTVTVQVDSVEVDSYCPSGQCSYGFVAISIERVAWLTASLCKLVAASRASVRLCKPVLTGDSRVSARLCKPVLTGDKCCV